MEGMTELERERAAIMERNRRMMMQLQLPGLAAGLAAQAAAAAGGPAGSGGSKSKASQRGVGAKRCARGTGGGGGRGGTRVGTWEKDGMGTETGGMGMGT